MTIAPGSRLGQYEVVSLIGGGGMGEVYRARDTKLGRDVALKVLPDVFADEPERLAEPSEHGGIVDTRIRNRFQGEDQCATNLRKRMQMTFLAVRA